MNAKMTQAEQENWLYWHIGDAFEAGDAVPADTFIRVGFMAAAYREKRVTRVREAVEKFMESYAGGKFTAWQERGWLYIGSVEAKRARGY